jgi:signal peptidase II
MTMKSSDVMAKPFPTWALVLLGCVVVIVDQYTKYLCSTNLELGYPVTVFQGFDLLLAHNAGVAFSFLNDAGGWQRWFLSGVAMVISGGVLVWLWLLPKQQYLVAVALTCILAGALGNLYDRVVLGYVVDFISVYYGEWRFATFNIADGAISVGAALLFLDMLKNGNHELKSKTGASNG